MPESKFGSLKSHNLEKNQKQNMIPRGASFIHQFTLLIDFGIKR